MLLKLQKPEEKFKERFEKINEKQAQYQRLLDKRFDDFEERWLEAEHTSK